MPLAAALPAVSDAQLELLFDAPAPTGAASAAEARENGPESAPQRQSGIRGANGHAERALGAAIPCDMPRGGEAGLLPGRLQVVSGRRLRPPGGHRRQASAPAPREAVTGAH